MDPDAHEPDSSGLTTLTAGMPIPYGGNRMTTVPVELARAFRAGDRLVVVQETGDLLHIPASEWDVASTAVNRAVDAFSRLGSVPDESITYFYECFARNLEDEATFSPIARANDGDVANGRRHGRSTTRLVLSPTMRADMVAGLRSWARFPSQRGEIVEVVEHGSWRVELVRAGLGVVGFVFEGRPNVFADAAGLLRSGNTVVFRIGSDALGTARAIVEHALHPALTEASLPEGSISLVDSPARSAGWAMFSDRRLALAVARGSGPAVSQLGAVARQAGVPVSLHGTGGAWIVAGAGADPTAFAAAVTASLDRKVCNTLNTCCVVADRAAELVPAFLDALEAAASERGVAAKLHVVRGQEIYIPDTWFTSSVISRAGGAAEEPQTEILDPDALGREWEWEESPEVTLAIVESVEEAADLFNRQSPRFVASLISDDAAEHAGFFDLVDAPFVGNGFTRWVDGQFALDRPELGLSNWQHGRLFGRGGVLSGDSVFTVRTRAIQDDPTLRR